MTTTEPPIIRVAVVDDHPVVREGLRAFLQLARDIEIVAEAENGLAAVALIQSETLDVVLMDLVMPGDLDGVAATRAILNACPDVRVIALTSFQDTERMMNALDAGAISYLQKDVNPDDLLYAIRQAALGRTVLEPAALQALRTARTTTDQTERSALQPDRRGDVEPLTQREQEVLEALAKGMSNKEIAGALGITEKTVKVHVSHILAKFGVYDRTQAILAASRFGFVTLQ